jgi:hypothetical protein
LHANERALSRCQKMCADPDDMPSYAQRIFSVLLRFLGDAYLHPLLDRYGTNVTFFFFSLPTHELY